MSNPLITEHNLETDEIINREMNEAELLDYEAFIAASKKAQAEAQAEADAKAALLERLGITEDEAKLLLS